MDYQTEQTSELELIQTVYPEELEVINDTYPGIKLKIDLPCVPKHENPEPDFYVTLIVSLPEKYPDEPPSIQLEGFPDHIPKEAIQEITDKLDEQSRSMPGYQVLITLITEVQYSVPMLIKQLDKKQEELEERLSREKEEAEQQKFEGNRVTLESFNKWREAFEREFFAAELEAKKAKDALLANKLTGRQQFLKNAALDVSDLTIIEKADNEQVDVDETLFEEELSDLDINEDSDE